MAPWLVQHFLNSSFFWPGVALIAAPIIIHLIHRLRYRRVRFAAMEFLLASEKRNRQRILFEQLLLLLLRILMVLLLVALIARLIVDPSELSLFQGSKAHHVVILDDSLSMRDRVSERTGFVEAEAMIRKLAAVGAERPGTQRLTLIRATRPTETISGLSERDIDESLVVELADRLEGMECSHQSADLSAALQAAGNRLQGDRAAALYVHVLSDFRVRDWVESAAAAEAMQQFATLGARVNLVRCSPQTHENVGIVELSGAVEVAAVGVPVTFTAKVRNFGTRVADPVRAQIFVDGERLPRTLDFGGVDPDAEAVRTFEVIFDAPLLHRLRLALEDDALMEDNVRYLAVNVPVENPVLIVDGSPAAEQALYIADALAADRSVTGFAPEIRKAEDLRVLELDKYHLIYLVDIGNLPTDALDALRNYVSGGGGLIWYMGDSVRPGFYNQELYADGGGLFPVLLGATPLKVAHDSRQSAADIEIGAHPMFQVLAGEENPFIDAVSVNRFYPVGVAAEGQTAMARNAKVLAELRGGSPLIVEHSLGAGRIVTCLTSAGPLQDPEGIVWNNWSNGPGKISFVVVQLEMAKYVSRRDRALPHKGVGEPIVDKFSRANYRDEIEFVSPDEQATRTKAVAEETASEAAGETAALTLTATYRDTDAPGIYSVTRLTQEQQPEQSLLAFNVPAEEGALAVTTDDQLRRQLGTEVDYSIQAFGKLDWIRSDSPGSEMRWLILIALCVIGMLEQWLAYRLSYHSAK